MKNRIVHLFQRIVKLEREGSPRTKKIKFEEETNNCAPIPNKEVAKHLSKILMVEG
jgi:hypothetical protein